MSKKNLFITFVVIFVLVLGGYFTYTSLLSDDSSDNSDTPAPVALDAEIINNGEAIGGQRDEFGCLGPAGYSWDEELEVCTRSWEINEDIKPAIVLAVDELNATSQYESLTVIRFYHGNCEDCYLLRLDRDGEFLSATVDLNEESVDIELTPQPIPTSEINTARKLVSEVAAQVFGFPRELQELEEADVAWNTEEELFTYDGVAAGIKDDYNASDIALVYSGVLENLRGIGFETDPFNAMSGTPEVDVNRLKKGNIVCNVVKTNTPDDGSRVVFQCADTN